MLIGYANTLPLDCSTQEKALDALGCDRTFLERTQSLDRESLRACIDYCSSGDTLIATQLEYLAVSIADFCLIQKELADKGVGLRIEALELDTNTIQGQQVLSTIQGIALFERNVMIARQREGIAKAKAKGKYKGRKPTCEEAKKLVEAMIINGKEPREIMQKMEIGKTTFYKIKKEIKLSEHR
ncbi:recombinase family protein [Vibrio sp. ZSDE26]|uniref:Recombinase family protein n=1 Tax=Vibrio amylolyticus TaxID=2847292 RepID=A0A9X1XP55_9VIBR|nr:recombinase family protein [Vibrio amylolyticus]MCK6265563.1 recombinase family protein [Vibrio amylolyticus]